MYSQSLETEKRKIVDGFKSRIEFKRIILYNYTHDG